MNSKFDAKITQNIVEIEIFAHKKRKACEIFVSQAFRLAYLLIL